MIDVDVVADVVHTLVVQIGIAVLVAGILSYLFNLAKLPLLLAYLATGVVIGTQMGFGLVSTDAGLNGISEIGLVLLLFMIGMEIDLHKLRQAGPSLVTVGITQFLVSASLALGVFVLLGYNTGNGSYDALYLATGMALSSTAVVVKLLYGKGELDTLGGRFTVGILVFQDVWAIIMLGIQPSLTHPDLLELALTFGKMVLMITVATVVARKLLPPVFARIAKVPELIILTTLAWCTAVSAFALWINLSLEMGALIAGIGVSSFPYTLDVEAKLTNVRDVLVMLFFVSLGMKIPNPIADPMVVAVALGAVVLVYITRLASVYPVLKTFKHGNRVSLLTSLNLANVSEFALVIGAIGVRSGHINETVLSIIIYAFVFGAVGATITSSYSEKIQTFLADHVLTPFGLKDAVRANQPEQPADPKEIAFIGLFQTASSMIEDMRRMGYDMQQESLLNKTLVIDFNPTSHESLRAMGVQTVYGDVAHLDTLHHAGIASIKVAISTISDSVLVGTDNSTIVRGVRTLCPNAKIIATADTTREAIAVYNAGADYVVVPRMVLSDFTIPIAELLLQSANGDKEAHTQATAIREEQLLLLHERMEVLG